MIFDPAIFLLYKTNSDIASAPPVPHQEKRKFISIFKRVG